MSAFDTATANKILADMFAPWVLATGIITDAVSTDSATLRIPFSAQLTRVGGIMSGQTLVTGADTAMVIALSAAMGGFKPVTTVDLTINYMRPVTKADAIITAKVMRLGRSLAFLTTEITEAGSIKPSAFATGTYAIPAQ
ncbi:MAG: PaaI family thioesterase [Hyphomicrobiaceae bacterium]